MVQLLAGLVSTPWLGLLAEPARADTLLLLHPTDDALVLSAPELVDQNYGQDQQIIAWANYPVYGARSYLRFDLSGIPNGETVTFARLNLFQFNGGGFASGVDVFRVAADTWSESLITWNNQPVLVPAANDLIAQNPTLTGAERGWVSFDLLASGQWNPPMDLAPGDDALSLIVRTSQGEVGTQRAHNFCSKESSGGTLCVLVGEAGPPRGREPQLIIGTPEPARGALIAAGILALVVAARRNRRSAE